MGWQREQLHGYLTPGHFTTIFFCFFDSRKLTSNVILVSGVQYSVQPFSSVLSAHQGKSTSRQGHLQPLNLCKRTLCFTPQCIFPAGVIKSKTFSRIRLLFRNRPEKKLDLFVVIKYYTLNGLEQQKCIVAQLWRLGVQNQRDRRAMFPLKPIGGGVFLCLSPRIWWFVAILGLSRLPATSYSTWISASVVTWCLPCISISVSSLLIRTGSRVGFRTHPT